MTARAARSAGGSGASRVEQPAHPVVGVPGPAGDRARVGHAVAHDPGRVAGHLQRPGRWCAASGAAAASITVTPMVSTACQSGRTSMRVISPSATLMSSWCACSPSRRLSDRRPRRRPRSGRGAAGRPPWSSRTRPSSRCSPVPTPRSRARASGVLVAGRLPGHRHLRRAAGLQQHRRGRRRAPEPGPRTATDVGVTAPRRRPAGGGPGPAPGGGGPDAPTAMRIPCHLPAGDPPGADREENQDPMPAIVLIGAQWGDEGKGKATDLLGGRGRLRRALPGRQQRRAHRDHPGRREVRAAPDPVGDPHARAARR